MLRKLHELLTETLGGELEEPADEQQEIRLAAAVLLVEIARADAGEAAHERQQAERLLQQRFDLDSGQSRQLIELASDRVDESISLFEFTNRLKDALDEPGRGDIVEMLWDVVYADGEVDRYEEHLMRRISDLLYVTHSEFIRRKHLAADRYASRNGQA